MNKLPLISIIIPVYNSEEYLLDTLNSLIKQTYKNLEIIIVNNGSSGNTEEIFNDYKKTYSDFKWVLISLNENIGLLHARLKGFSQMTGDYFTTMDSDDTVSIDFYYQLLHKAIKEKADIVSTHYVHDFIGKEGMMHFPMNDMELCDFCWEGKEVLQKFMNAKGRSFNYHALWCKLYSRKIWEDSQSSFKRCSEKLVLHEDILTTTIFLSNAAKWVNIHNVYYYHAVRTNNATSDMASSVKKVKSSFDQAYFAFKYIEDYLKEISRYEELKEDFLEYRRRFASIIFSKCVFDDNLSASQKKLCHDYACKILDYDDIKCIEPDTFIFESKMSPFNNDLEAALEMISSKDIKTVSFDIFDTLIERTTGNPQDAFELLSLKYNRYKKNSKCVDFARIRSNAERTAREKIIKNNPNYREVTLDEIYEELVKEGVFTASEASGFKQAEIEMEYRLCREKKIGKYLYDFALRQGKKVICISDMYLPQNVVEEILIRNGYDRIERFFISSEERKCKYDGELFKKVIKRLKLEPKEICHIGDNYISDYVAPEKIGIKHIYLSSAKEMFMGRNGLTYSGGSFQHIVGDVNNPIGAWGSLGNRCMYGVAANKTFGNPFMRFNTESDFDSNPNIIGYYIMGTYVFTVAKWIIDMIRERNYDTIHFIARDGYVIKKAYDILASHSVVPLPKSNYLYVSRSALMPAMIHNRDDLFALNTMLDFKSYSPVSFLEYVKEIIPDEIFERKEKILSENNILPDSTFSNDDEWNNFICVFAKNFFDQKSINKYTLKMRNSLGKIIGKHDCTFDAGYSVRTETLLYDLTDNKVDAFYLFVNEERAFKQAKKLGISLNFFHSTPAGFSDMLITECLISSTGGSCKGYEINQDSIKYIFSKSNIDEETAFIINLIQQRAIEFVADYVEAFPEWESLEYRFMEKPFEYYLRHAKSFDKGILFKLKNKDENSSLNQDSRTVDLWITYPPQEAKQNEMVIIGVKGALINYFKKHTPYWLRSFAKKIKKIIKW